MTEKPKRTLAEIREQARERWAVYAERYRAGVAPEELAREFGFGVARAKRIYGIIRESEAEQPR